MVKSKRCSFGSGRDTFGHDQKQAKTFLRRALHLIGDGPIAPAPQDILKQVVRKLSKPLGDHRVDFRKWKVETNETLVFASYFFWHLNIRPVGEQ